MVQNGGKYGVFPLYFEGQKIPSFFSLSSNDLRQSINFYGSTNTKKLVS